MGALFNIEFVKLGFAGLFLHQIWKVFSHYFCRYSSSPFSPPGIPTIQILACLKVSLGSHGLYSLFSPFVFFLFPRLYNSNCPIFIVANSFFCPLKSAYEPVQCIFSFHLLYLSSRLSFWLLIFSTLLILFGSHIILLSLPMSSFSSSSIFKTVVFKFLPRSLTSLLCPYVHFFCSFDQTILSYLCNL